MFRERADEQIPSVLSAVFADDAPTVVAFAGHPRAADSDRLGGLAAFSPIGFFQLLARLPLNRVLVRDPRAMFYQRGFSLSDDPLEEDLADLRRQLSGSGRLVVWGICAGAMAAVPAGVLLDADEINLVAPWTFIDAATCERMGEYRSARERLAGMDSGGIQNVARWASGRVTPPINVWVSSGHERDRAQAKNLASVSCVSLTMLNSDTHYVTDLMLQNGELEREVRRSAGV